MFDIFSSINKDTELIPATLTMQSIFSLSDIILFAAFFISSNFSKSK